MFLIRTDVGWNRIFMGEEEAEEITDSDPLHADQIDTVTLLEIFAQFFGVVFPKRQRIGSLSHNHFHAIIVPLNRLFGNEVRYVFYKMISFLAIFISLWLYLIYSCLMKYIDEANLTHKTVLLRVDFNVSFSPHKVITDDTRIQQSLPTINYLLKRHNKIIIVAHLGDPEKRNAADSLTRVAKRLQEYLPLRKIHFVEDFETDNTALLEQKPGEIVMLENIRFYPGEKANDREFAKKLASLADTYVNDAFSVSHRKAASIVLLPSLLPAYGGLLLKKEVAMLEKIMKHPKKPMVAIIGGRKIATKIKFIKKLASVADYLLLGGGLANTFLAGLGHEVGNSIISKDDLQLAKNLIKLSKKEGTELVLPSDVVVARSLESRESEVKDIDKVGREDQVLDIGPKSQAEFGTIIAKAKMIIWNGPVGFFENPVFKRGTDFLYYAITHNPDAVSVLGGGDTLAAISKKEDINRITHVSTGGGAMLEFIENGTLPGIEALQKHN